MVERVRGSARGQDMAVAPEINGVAASDSSSRAFVRGERIETGPFSRRGLALRLARCEAGWRLRARRSARRVIACLRVVKRLSKLSRLKLGRSLKYKRRQTGAGHASGGAHPDECPFGNFVLGEVISRSVDPGFPREIANAKNTIIVLDDSQRRWHCGYSPGADEGEPHVDLSLSDHRTSCPQWH
jgi:hypothetical protein